MAIKSNVRQIEGLQRCFTSLQEEENLLHSWNDLNVLRWERKEILKKPIQEDKYVRRIFFFPNSVLVSCDD